MALRIADYKVLSKEAAQRYCTGSDSKESAQKELCLDFSSQSLSNIPLDITAEPQHLQFLFLQNNQIETLPSNFFQQLPNLRHLDLRENKLLEIPESIADHDKLEVLLLQNNDLKTLPCELGQVPRLRKLQISGNPISWPPVKILSEGLDAILSFLRGTYREQLSQGAVIPKANKYECTKDVQSYANVDSSGIKTQHHSQNSITLDEETFIPPTSISFGPLQESKVGDIQEKSVNEIILRKGKSKLLKNCASSSRIKTAPKDIKGPSLRPTVSARHAQAIMNGQSFPLGYRKRTASPSTTKVYKTLLKKLWLNQLKCVLQSQDQALQKQKTSEALRQWRQDARTLKQNASQQNWSGIEPPFDFDSECMKMVTRSGLLMFQNTSLEKKGHEKPHKLCPKAMGLQDKIVQILSTFEELAPTKRISQPKNSDPATQCKLLEDEMKRISDLQKAVQALRLSI